MCIICLKRKNQTFEPALVERMIEMGNRDGFGLMYVEGPRDAAGKIVGNKGRVKVVKSMGKVSEVSKIWEEHMDNNIAVHVRNATLGAENEENCHPYTVLSKDLGHKIDLEMMHNGTIKDVQVDKDFSDSYNFATKFLRGYLEESGYKTLYQPAFQRFLCAMIGPNKLLFLDSFERFTVINRDMWSIHSSGCLVSTFSDIKVFTPPFHRSPTYNYGTSYTSTEDKSPATIGKFKDGFWRMDVDGRSHFMTKKEQVDVRDTKSTDATGTGSGTDNGTEPPLDEESVEEWIDKIRAWDEAAITAFVIENPLEAVSALMSLSSGETLLHAGMMVAHNAEEAARNLYIMTRKEQVGNL